MGSPRSRPIRPATGTNAGSRASTTERSSRLGRCTTRLSGRSAPAGSSPLRSSSSALAAPRSCTDSCGGPPPSPHPPPPPHAPPLRPSPTEACGLEIHLDLLFMCPVKSLNNECKSKALDSLGHQLLQKGTFLKLLGLKYMYYNGIFMLVVLYGEIMDSRDSTQGIDTGCLLQPFLSLLVVFIA